MANKDKKKRLKEQGVLNQHSNKVTEQDFKESLFFDPDDLAQVKYEMVRQVCHEGKSVSEAAKNFGLSRPTLYQARDIIDREGLLGLVPQKSGPQTRHKLNDKVMAFIREKIDEDKYVSTKTLAEFVKKQFALSVHPRSIERALAAQKKTPDTTRGGN